MSAPLPSDDLAALVARADGGAPEARERLFAVLYDELHRLARREVARQGSSSPLGVTTLLHEAYLAVASGGALAFPTQGHFLSYAAKAMRGVLIDRIRHDRAQRRGGGVRATTLDGEHPGRDADPEELLAIHDALEMLERLDPGLAHVVDLHFFCGFAFTEIAAMHGVAERTVQRQWAKARTLLRQLLDGVA